MKKSEIIIKVGLILLFIFFFLSAIGYIHLINYNDVANIFGIGEKANIANAVYASILVGFSILYLVIFFIIIIISVVTRKDFFKEMDFMEKIIEIFKEKENFFYDSIKKLCLATILAFIIKLIFINFKLFNFDCYKVNIVGGTETYCGTNEQIIFLIASMICLVHTVWSEKWNSK
ncbi:MAG: hypothetical protein NTW06_04715 [Candidatus Falkowbacteria bacterium]|nr:hypothetical protein [Candidatus Falkowbacteria bacterium]